MWPFRKTNVAPVIAERPRFSSDDYSRLALDMIYPYKSQMETDDSFYGGTVIEGEATASYWEKLRGKFEDVPDPRLKKAINSWIDWYKKRAIEDLEDCRTQKRKKEMDRYDERRRAETNRVNELRTHIFSDHH